MKLLLRVLGALPTAAIVAPMLLLAACASDGENGKTISEILTSGRGEKRTCVGRGVNVSCEVEGVEPGERCVCYMAHGVETGVVR